MLVALSGLFSFPPTQQHSCFGQPYPSFGDSAEPVVMHDQSTSALIPGMSARRSRRSTWEH